MSEQQLPEGWQIVKFGDIAKHISKRVEPSETDLDIYVGLEHLDPDSLKIKRHGIPDDVKGQKLLVKEGQIIFGKRRAYQRKVAVADWDCICSAHAMVLEANPEKVVPEFLPFIIRSDAFMDRAIAISEGSLSPTIKWKVLAAQNFSIPSIEEQKRLLLLLRKASQIELITESVEKSLSTLHEMLVVHETKSDHDIRSLKSARELKLPKDWKMFSLQDLAEDSKNSFVIGPFGSDLVVNDFKKAGMPVVFVRDIKSNKYKWISDTYVDQLKFDKLKAHQVRTGDLVITKMGLPPGIAAVYPDDTPDGIVTADIIRLRPNTKVVNPEYLALFINSRFFRQQVRMITAGQTRPKLTLGDFKKLVVYLPDLKKQNDVVNSIETIRCIKFKNKMLNTIVNCTI